MRYFEIIDLNGGVTRMQETSDDNRFMLIDFIDIISVYGNNEKYLIELHGIDIELKYQCGGIK